MSAVIRQVSQRWLGQEAIPLWPCVFLFATAYYAAAWLGRSLSVTGTINVNFWLPAGVYLAVLLLNPRSHWPWLAASTPPINIMLLYRLYRYFRSS